MKTIKQAIDESGISAKLVNSVVRTVGKDYLLDLMNHGAACGFPGITYHNETCAFFKRNKKDILALTQEMAESLGEDMLQMIAGFSCLRDMKFSTYEIAQGIDGRGDASTQVQNALCWFACEEVALAVCDD